MAKKNPKHQAQAGEPEDGDRPLPYEVGYGRPPLATRFQSGKCPNPKGRPKGSKNTSKIWEEELNQPVTVTENGKRKRIPKRQAIIRQQVNKSLAGDPKAAQLVTNQMRHLEQGPIASSPLENHSPNDANLVASIVRRIRLNSDLPTSDDVPPGSESPPEVS